MPRDDISCEARKAAGAGGKSSTYQLHHGNVFKSIFTLSLSASFFLPVIQDAFTSFPKTAYWKRRTHFSIQEQGRFKRNGPNLNSERIKYSAYHVHRPYYSSFTSSFLCIIVSSCRPFKCESAAQVQISLTTDQLSTGHPHWSHLRGEMYLKSILLLFGKPSTLVSLISRVLAFCKNRTHDSNFSSC